MASAMIHERINELAMLKFKKASECTSQSVMREALVGDKLVSSLRFNPSTSAGQVVKVSNHNGQHCTFCSGRASDLCHLHATTLATLVQSCCNIRGSNDAVLDTVRSEHYRLLLVSTFRLEASMH
jgi:hypothetical protein